MQRIKWSHFFLVISLITLILLLFSYTFQTETNNLVGSELRDWVNDEASNIEQDDPDLVRFVRDNHIFPATNLPYNFATNDPNPSYGHLQSVLPLLRTDSGGFFVEAGANDGEWGSNTLYLERKLGWAGLLVEASPLTFAKLLKKNRKTWHSNAALSVKDHPSMATFYENEDPSLSIWGGLTYRFYHKNVNQVKVQCVPLYTLLLAINRTVVDFLSLDLEGSELDVLRTVPFDKVDIKAIAVEVINGKEGPEPVKQLMAKNGFHLHQTIAGLDDLVFISEELHQKKTQMGN